MIDYHKYVGYCRPDEKEKNRWEGVVGGGTKKNRFYKLKGIVLFMTVLLNF